jgi:hypothetical protein
MYYLLYNQFIRIFKYHFIWIFCEVVEIPLWHVFAKKNTSIGMQKNLVNSTLPFFGDQHCANIGNNVYILVSYSILPNFAQWPEFQKPPACFEFIIGALRIAVLTILNGHKILILLIMKTWYILAFLNLLNRTA